MARRKENRIERKRGVFCTTPPNWAFEFLSPSTRKLDEGLKSDIYAREGVSHLWLLDPVLRTLKAFVATNGAWRDIAHLRDDAEVSVPPFVETSFPLSELWEYFE